MTLEDIINDPEFVGALKKGDRRVFTRLVRLYEDRIFSLCFRILGSREEAIEVAQEVFVTVFRRVRAFRGASKLSTWLYRIATNHALNRAKYLARRRTGAHQSIEDANSSGIGTPLRSDLPRPDEVFAARELENYLRACLQELDRDQRAVLVLRDMEGLSYQEIAEITGLNMGTIKSRLHRGRIRMKMALEKWTQGRLESGDKG